MNFDTEQKVFEQVVEEAWNNPDFKAALIDNPVQAIESLTGKKVSLPEGIDHLVVNDQSAPRTAYFNIPPKAEMDTELTEDQLEAVAGGVMSIPGDPYGGGCIWPPTSTGPFIPIFTLGDDTATL